jgi:hypothetical protein
VCAFVGEDFEPTMLHMGDAPSQRARVARDDGAVRLSPVHVGRFRTRVPPRELAFMQSQLRGRLRAWGYPVDPVRLGPAQRAAWLARDWPDQTLRMAAWRTVEALQQQFPQHVRRRPSSTMVLAVAPEGTG